MSYEPLLVAPFENSNLKKWFKPWLIGPKAFPVIQDAYARRGVVRKREGMRLLASFPNGDAPVQGLKNWINRATLGESLIGFSLSKSYLFNDGTQTFSDITHLSDMTAFTFGNGTNDYYWSSNFAGSMWIANGKGLTTASPFPLPANGIFYLTVNGDNAWNIHQPQIDGIPTYLNGCLIVLPYKGRLVCLNTFEGDISGSNNLNYSNRARWSQLGGSPYSSTGGGHNTSPPSPYVADNNSWRGDIPGRGTYLDADTSERIVSAAIIKDTLIVTFQRSTWRLRYTGNEINPFIWERLNTQYGCESPYSAVTLEDSALFFSRFGWIASTTNDTKRIDLDIVDDAFAFEGTNTNITGLNKCQGIRDFYRNFAYFTYIPIGQTNATQIYAYNYIDRSWTIFNPSVNINVFGNYRNTAGDFTWSVLTAANNTWADFNSPDNTWQNFGSGQNEDFPYILGGDLNGNVYLMFEFFQAPTSDNGTPFNFTITSARINPAIEMGHRSRLGFVDIYATTTVGGEITLQHFIDDQQTPILTKTVEIFSRGVVSISNIAVGSSTTINTASDHDLDSGEYATFSDITGSVGNILNDNSYVVTVTSPTQFTIALNTSGYSYSSGGYVYSADIGNNDATYVRVFLGAIGRMHQITLTLSNTQLTDSVKSLAQFELQGLVFWFRKCGRIRH